MKRVLLADDDPALRSALRLLLEAGLGLTVVAEAGTMEAALAAAALTRPDAILLDWELPGEPQADRPAALRQAAPGLKVFVTSARPEAAAPAGAAQADAFVDKAEPPEAILHLFRGA
ncbi:MAG: response regulator [Anaerolineales bacterium]|nr:response regulator [Anaerolineales bacterium]